MGFCFHGYQFEHVNFLSDPRHTRDRILSMHRDEGMLEGMHCIRSVHILRNGAYLNIQTRYSYEQFRDRCHLHKEAT